MRILLLSSIYPEPEEYGIPDDTAAVHYFAKEFVNLGHEVVVCHLYSNPVSRITQKALSSTIKVNHRDNVRVLFSEIQILIPHRFSAFKWQQIRAAKKFKVYLKNRGFSPDLILAHFPSTFPWFCKSLVGEKRACCVLHNTDLVALEKELDTKSRKLIGLFETTFDCFGFRSKRLFDRGMIVGIGNETSPIINSGIPSQLVRDRNDIERKQIDNRGPLNLIFVGKLVEQKRVHVILKALKICQSECRLRIIGEGSYKNDLMKLARELQIDNNVDFLGKLPRNVVANEMYNSDVFIMVSKNETLGLVYFEAMASGCITIGSKGEGIDGIINNYQNGFLVTPDNEIELAKVIDAIGNGEKSDIDQIRMEGYELASKMTDSVAAQEYLEKMLWKQGGN